MSVWSQAKYGAMTLMQVHSECTKAGVSTYGTQQNAANFGEILGKFRWISGKSWGRETLVTTLCCAADLLGNSGEVSLDLGEFMGPRCGDNRDKESDDREAGGKGEADAPLLAQPQVTDRPTPHDSHTGFESLKLSDASRVDILE